ncbi:MAG: hypothetical protein KAT85_10720 [candidate division Zixibacteria bacterium]|nr:hypothetical protein [candidate division Zixibacteria bacterium]
MSNYQILEIALDVAFFATVASVMVIFAIVRERYIRKSLTEQLETALFPEVLAEAGSPIPSADDISGGTVKKDRGGNVPSRVEPGRAAVAGRRRLSRSEMELMSSLSSSTGRS